MKLRNKKTGIIGELNITNRIVVYEPDMPLCGNSILGEYDTLNELNKEWEDIREPIIKDEKIRKAVRAWAEANGLHYVNSYESAHAWYLRAFNSREQGIDIYFWGYQLPKELGDCQSYTITELCGEDENE